MDFPDFRSWLDQLEALTKTPRPAPEFYCGYCSRWAPSGHPCRELKVNWDEPLPRRFREDR